MSRSFQKPHVFLLAGMSLDGKISNFKHEQSEICSNDDYRLRWEGRLRADAIMAGGHQVLWDDPGLSVKNEERRRKRIKAGKTEEPIKVAVITDAGKINLEGNFMTRGSGEKVIFTTRQSPAECLKELKKRGDIKVFVLGENRVNLVEAMKILSGLGIKELMVEGGGTLIASLLKEKLIDEVIIKIGNLFLGGKNTITLCEGEGFENSNAPGIKIEKVEVKTNYVVIRGNIIKP